MYSVVDAIWLIWLNVVTYMYIPFIEHRVTFIFTLHHCNFPYDSSQFSNWLSIFAYIFHFFKTLYIN